VLTYLLLLPLSGTIHDLGDPRFHVRHTAEKRLASRGLLAAPAVLLTEPTSPEQERRLEQLAERLSAYLPLLWAASADRLSDDFILERRAELSVFAAGGPKQYHFRASHGVVKVERERIRTYMSSPIWHTGTEAGDWRVVMKQWLPQGDDTCDTP